MRPVTIGVIFDSYWTHYIIKSKLKDITRTKDELNMRLEKISQKIEILLNNEKLRQKNAKQNLTDIIVEDDDIEKYNLHLAEMQKNEKNIRQKYEKDIQKAINKKNEELDKKEKNIKDLKKNYLMQLEPGKRNYF